MSYIPKIYIEEDPKVEVEMFYRGLHNKILTWQRGSILDNFNSLKKLLDSGEAKNEEQEKQVVAKFLRDYRNQHQKQIDDFVALSRKELAEKSQTALAALAGLMGYKWPEKFAGYKVIPVLLPYGPFGKNVFFYSILAAVWNDKQQQYSILFTAVHEISHMMFYDILDNSASDLPSNIESRVAIFDLKEILAPVLMKQSPLKELLDFSMYPKDRWPDGYLGNDEFIQMYVTSEEMENKVQITRYFQDLYEKMRNEGQGFREILAEMVRLVTPLEDQFVEKRKLWFEHTFRIFKSKELLEEYAKPIRLANL